MELAPTGEQRARLAQHAGLSRVVEKLLPGEGEGRAEQREAERTYGIGDPDLTPVPWSAPACGIDLGAKTFATISDDDGAVTELHAPKPLKAALRRLCEANKAVARKEPGSGSSHLQGGLVRIERVAG